MEPLEKLREQLNDSSVELVPGLKNVARLSDGSYIHLNCGHVWRPIKVKPKICYCCHTVIRERPKIQAVREAKVKDGWKPLCACGAHAAVTVGSDAFCYSCLQKWAESQRKREVSVSEETIRDLLGLSD